MIHPDTLRDMQAPAQAKAEARAEKDRKVAAAKESERAAMKAIRDAAGLFYYDPRLAPLRRMLAQLEHLHRPPSRAMPRAPIGCSEAEKLWYAAGQQSVWRAMKTLAGRDGDEGQ